jgi:peptide/nickel transport system substrate-binding protein
VAAAVTGVLVLSACGGSTAGSSGSSGAGSVTYGEPDTWPQNLFPYISAGATTTEQDLLGRVLPGAFIVQPDFTVKYDDELLSAEPTSTVTNGQQVVTYKINPAAVWSDGTPINADDFTYTWHVSTGTAQGGCPDNLNPIGLQNIQDITGAEAGKTVTVTFATPFADWRTLFSGGQPLLPAHLMADSDPTRQCQIFAAGWKTADGLPSDISGGPWQLRRRNIDDGGQAAVLTPNPRYWGKKPALSRLILHSVGGDPSVQVQGLRNGELDVVRPPPQLDLVDQLERLAPDVTVQVDSGLSFEHVDFNTAAPPLADIAVREAFAMALDRQQIVDQTVGEFAPDAQVLDNRMYVNNQPQYQDDAPGRYRAQDIAGAKALLESDGYVLGSDGVYAKGGRRLSFAIDTTTNNPLRQTTIFVIAQQLAAAGFEISANPNVDLFAEASTPTSMEAGGFQIALFSWISSPFVSANQSIYQSPSRGLGQNYSRAGSPQIDALLDRLSTDVDPAQQAADANAADALLWQQLATIPLYQKPTFVAYRSTLTHVQVNASVQGTLWNSDDWAVR